MATLIVDVREDIRNGLEPFSTIMTAVSSLGPEDSLELLVPFQPVPLYKVMSKQGFEHEAVQTTDGEWKVTFFRPSL